MVEKLQKKNRIAAVILMGSINSLYGWVIVHNYRASDELRAGRR
jgi:hypothetical protein